MRTIVHRPVVRNPGLLLLSLLATSLVLIVHQYSRHVAFEQDPSSSRASSFNVPKVFPPPPPPPARPAVPGHMGEPFTLPQDIDRVLPAVQEQIALGWQRQGYNQLVSDLISVHRQLPDVRDPWCRRTSARQSGAVPLPPVSVVIVFHDEALSALLRTVHSVLSRSPAELLQEIVLVDDWSSSVQLKTFLDDYFFPYGDKVRILRTPKRFGLIRARVYGARRTAADHLVFLDAHCECTDGWLEPLLELMVDAGSGRSVVAVPTIDWLNETTLAFQPRPSAGLLYGAFDWDLSFQWRPRYDRRGWEREKMNPLEPFDSPVMAGGLFGIEKAFFARLGWYDPGLQVAGGENMELSFKVWMCGGAIRIVPCSRVAHIQKRNRPHIGSYRRERELTMANTLRVAEIWLDEYADFLYRLHPDYRALLASKASSTASSSAKDSLTERRHLRTDLFCHSFRWYLQNVFPEQDDPGRAAAMGWLRNDQAFCLAWPMRDRSLAVLPCHGLGGQQLWFFYDAVGLITREGHCLQAEAGSPLVTMQLCRSGGALGAQVWHYRKETGQLVHVASGRCLMPRMEDLHRLTVGPCALPDVVAANATGQRWTFQIDAI